MADDDELAGLEDELAELEDELADLEDEPAESSEPVEETPEPAEDTPEEGGLVDTVRDRLSGDDTDDEPDPEPAGEPAEADPEPHTGAQEEEPPWDREGDAWTAEGEEAGEGGTVIVRRLDEDGNVVEERRGSRADIPREDPPPEPNPPPDPEPADDPEDDDDGRGGLVLLLVAIVVLAVVGAGAAYLALGDDGGIGGSDGPTASFTRSPDGTVATGTEVSFDASDSTIPEGASATYEWTFGDGTTAQGRQVSHTYTTAGTHQVELVVTADGKQSSAAKEITVAEAPEARITAQVNGSQVGADNPVFNDTEVAFSGADSTAGGPITSYEWSVDGASDSGAQVTATFPDPGAKVVELTVTTDQGFTDTTSVTVGVGYQASYEGTLPAALDGPSQGPAHNFTVGHDGLVASSVEATLNYTTGTGGPLQDPTPAQLNVTDGAGQQVANAEGSDGLAEVSVSNPGDFVPGTWTARAEQDQGGAEKSYTLDVVVVYPTQ